MNYIKNYPLSLLLTVAVVALSTLPIGAPEFAKDVPLADKWTIVPGPRPWVYFSGDACTLPYWAVCWSWCKNTAPPTAPANGLTS